MRRFKAFQHGAKSRSRVERIARVKVRTALRVEGGRGSRSIRRALATEMSAIAAAVVCGRVMRAVM